jgi:hypothetical protein
MDGSRLMLYDGKRWAATWFAPDGAKAGLKVRFIPTEGAIL